MYKSMHACMYHDGNISLLLACVFPCPPSLGRTESLASNAKYISIHEGCGGLMHDRRFGIALNCSYGTAAQTVVQETSSITLTTCHLLARLL